MCRGRQRAEWQRTADLKATLLEINRDRKRRKRPFTADEFNPYREEKPEPILTDDEKQERQRERQAFFESLVRSEKK